ncbi:MAG: threonine/serine exporter [Ruminococcaceae bacterium]|nr:threonine/serine exporter [Oscillospiraceae bacterium]
MEMSTIIIQIISSFFGTLGFGFLFNIRGKKLIYAAVGGMLSWGLFLALGLVFESEALRYFLVSLCSTAYAEILARILKTPATTFSIITLIPLVPGGALYHTATFAMNGNLEEFIAKFVYTISLALALSLGIVVMTAIFRYYNKLKKS